MSNPLHDSSCTKSSGHSFVFLLACCLGIFTLSVQAQLSAQNPSPLLQSLRYYEIVQVTPHHTASSEPQPKHPETLKLHFTAFEQNFALHLHKNNDLFHPSYREERIDGNGDVIETRTLADIEHCYYHGHVVGDQTSVVPVLYQCCCCQHLQWTSGHTARTGHDSQRQSSVFYSTCCSLF